MARKPKARKAAAKAKSGDRSEKAARDKETQKAQSARFIEAARAIGVDESGREFEQAFEKIVPTKRRASVGANKKDP